ncbi:uncharacterized protein LOC131663991 [Phymastichus coffea]|uniref:uncharacterized protein LOC131663991 n=1 Tax=Phymastichus coffea TaxID=108790 RepID=UPI00273C16D3|nr:uncharacterized protein LOC131663991 [Phymastichus coffea]
MSVYKVIYLAVYCTIKLTQAYTYAWLGHIINVESEACVDSIYHANWTGQRNLRFMKDALIVLSQNPMHFQALSIITVRLDMFSKIINKSVSHFFLLKMLNKNLEAS